jgi:predicted kinase
MTTSTQGLPLLLIITGPSASGKTTLAHLLARRIGCPVISRDEIKEGLMNTVERGGELSIDPAKHTYEVFFETIEFLIGKSVSVIAEAAFQHPRWAAKLERLQSSVEIKIIHCSTGPTVASERFARRTHDDPNRTRFHGETVDQPSTLPITNFDRLRLDVPSLIVDTSDGYDPDLDTIVAFVRGD